MIDDQKQPNDKFDSAGAASPTEDVVAPTSDDALSDALEDTFPASDPIAVGSPTGTEAPARGRNTPRAETRDDLQFTVGLKAKGKVHHVVVEGEDALIAALKVKCQYPEALIIYVRRRNRRGDARHPPVAEKM